MKSYLKHYKPTRNAWKAVAIIAVAFALMVSAIAVTFIVCGGNVKAGAVWELQIQNGPTIIHHHPKKTVWGT